MAYVSRANTYYRLGDQDKVCLDVDKACQLGDCTNFDRARKNGYCK